MLQIYDSPEALKKFEPHYRQVRYGLATKIEKASRQHAALAAGSSGFARVVRSPLRPR